MADNINILLAFYKEDWTQARQAENQRTAIANIILIIVPLLIGFIVEKNLSMATLPITLSLIVLGAYGMTISQKLYERHCYFSDRAGVWRDKIISICADLELDKIKEQHLVQHRKKFNMFYPIRLYHLWILLHFFVILSGIVLTLLVLLSNTTA